MRRCFSSSSWRGGVAGTSETLWRSYKRTVLQKHQQSLGEWEEVEIEGTCHFDKHAHKKTFSAALPPADVIFHEGKSSCRMCPA